MLPPDDFDGDHMPSGAPNGLADYDSWKTASPPDDEFLGPPPWLPPKGVALGSPYYAECCGGPIDYGSERTFHRAGCAAKERDALLARIRAAELTALGITR